MAKKLALLNGVPRMVDESAAPTIYDQHIDIVVSGASGPNQLNQSSATAGTSITLPGGGTYQGAELEVYFNGARIESVIDYNYVGTGTRTQISFTFDLLASDRIRFRVDRSA